ncbi:MAG: phosphopantetheine-binding protein [Cyclobacteriaceae bacterium]|nr:phosphopantetheine-binding protein [Cyclobacteriaceae bacterium]
MREIKSTIRDFIVRKIMFKEDSTLLDFDELLLETGIVDSVGIIQLTEFLQAEFKVSIKTRDMVMENFTNVEAISSLVQNLVDQKRST